MPLIANLILAGAGTLIGDYFQKKSAKIAEKQEQIAQDIEAAKSTFTRVSTTMEGVVFYGSQVMREIWIRKTSRETQEFDDEDLAKYWNNYSESMANWSKTHYLMMANVRHSFGENAELNYREIYDEIREFDERLFAKYHQLNRNAKVKEDGFEFFKNEYEEKKASFFTKLSNFNMQMSNLILSRKVGSLKE